MTPNEKSAQSDVRVSSFVAGTGWFVPEKVVLNSYFESYLDTSDQWIRERTGIAERRWAEADASMSDLAEPAARAAIADAGIDASELSAIIVATVTPDYVFPSTACVLQKRLGISGSIAFDVNAVCSGFLYAFTLGDSMIRSGQARHVLVIGADMYSRIVDLNDRGTCVLFGDGAGAMVLSAVDSASIDGHRDSPTATQGVYTSELHADGAQGGILMLPVGTAAPATPESLARGQHFLTMEGREVFKLAVRGLADVNRSVLEKAGLELGQVDHFVSHQANARILSAVAKQLDVSESKFPMNVQRYGNTSAASVPILFSESVERGIIKRGDLVVLSAFGAGLTWGASVLRY